MSKKTDCHTYEYGNAIIVVHRPALDEPQLEKRIRQIKVALANYGATIRNEQKEVIEWESSQC